MKRADLFSTLFPMVPRPTNETETELSVFFALLSESEVTVPLSILTKLGESRDEIANGEGKAPLVIPIPIQSFTNPYKYVLVLPSELKFIFREKFIEPTADGVRIVATIEQLLAKGRLKAFRKYWGEWWCWTGPVAGYLGWNTCYPDRNDILEEGRLERVKLVIDLKSVPNRRGLPFELRRVALDFEDEEPRVQLKFHRDGMLGVLQSEEQRVDVSPQARKEIEVQLVGLIDRVLSFPLMYSTTVQGVTTELTPTSIRLDDEFVQVVLGARMGFPSGRCAQQDQRIEPALFFPVETGPWGAEGPPATDARVMFSPNLALLFLTEAWNSCLLSLPRVPATIAPSTVQRSVDAVAEATIQSPPELVLLGESRSPKGGDRVDLAFSFRNFELTFLGRTHQDFNETFEPELRADLDVDARLFLTRSRDGISIHPGTLAIRGLSTELPSARYRSQTQDELMSFIRATTEEVFETEWARQVSVPNLPVRLLDTGSRALFIDRVSHERSIRVDLRWEEKPSGENSSPSLIDTIFRWGGDAQVTPVEPAMPAQLRIPEFIETEEPVVEISVEAIDESGATIRDPIYLSYSVRRKGGPAAVQRYHPFVKMNPLAVRLPEVGEYEIFVKGMSDAFQIQAAPGISIVRFKRAPIEAPQVAVPSESAPTRPINTRAADRKPTPAVSVESADDPSFMGCTVSKSTPRHTSLLHGVVSSCFVILILLFTRRFF